MAIRSCKMFIGAMSGALTIAHACMTQRMVLLHGMHMADVREQKMTTMWENVYFNMREIIERSRSDILLEKIQEKDNYIETLQTKIAHLEKQVGKLLK